MHAEQKPLALDRHLLAVVHTPIGVDEGVGFNVFERVGENDLADTRRIAEHAADGFQLLREDQPLDLQNGNVIDAAEGAGSDLGHGKPVADRGDRDGAARAHIVGQTVALAVGGQLELEVADVRVAHIVAVDRGFGVGGLLVALLVERGDGTVLADHRFGVGRGDRGGLLFLRGFFLDRFLFRGGFFGDGFFGGSFLRGLRGGLFGDGFFDGLDDRRFFRCGFLRGRRFRCRLGDGLRLRDDGFRDRLDGLLRRRFRFDFGRLLRRDVEILCVVLGTDHLVGALVAQNARVAQDLLRRAHLLAGEVGQIVAERSRLIQTDDPVGERLFQTRDQLLVGAVRVGLLFQGVDVAEPEIREELIVVLPVSGKPPELGPPLRQFLVIPVEMDHRAVGITLRQAVEKRVQPLR